MFNRRVNYIQPKKKKLFSLNLSLLPESYFCQVKVTSNRISTLLQGISHMFSCIKLPKLFLLQLQLMVLTPSTMKFSHLASLKVQILKLRRKIMCSSSAVRLISVQKRLQENCCHVSYYARLLIWRFNSQWKQILRRKSNTIRYNYDAQSYSQNFDEGRSDDNPSPLAPR